MRTWYTKIQIYIYILNLLSLTCALPFSLSVQSAMVRTRFYRPVRTATRSTQGDQNKKTKRPKLSQEAQASLRARRRASRELYSDAMKTAVAQVNEITENLAISQHKSIRRVEKDLRFASQLTRKQHQKTNAWNAWIWSISREKGNIDGTHEGLFYSA